MNPLLKQRAEAAQIAMVSDARLEEFARAIVNDLANIVENQGKFLRYDDLADQLRRRYE
jgi:hypothetical protein